MFRKPQTRGAIFSTTGNPLFHPPQNGDPGRGGEDTNLFVDRFSCMIAHFVCILMEKTSMRDKVNKN